MRGQVSHTSAAERSQLTTVADNATSAACEVPPDLAGAQVLRLDRLVPGVVVHGVLNPRDGEHEDEGGGAGNR